MFMVLENFRDFEKDDFPVDIDGKYTICDNCYRLDEQYIVIEKKCICKGCLVC